MGKYLDLLAATGDISDISDESCSKSCSQHVSRNAEDAFGRFCRFGRTLAELERRVPKHVTSRVWQTAIEDGRRFVAEWGPQADGLGWTARDLFGLHMPPDNPSQSYSRLSRLDGSGLIWLLNGRRVVALTKHSASIKGTSGTVTRYYRMKTSQQGPAALKNDDRQSTEAASGTK